MIITTKYAMFKITSLCESYKQKENRKEKYGNNILIRAANSVILRYYCSKSHKNNKKGEDKKGGVDTMVDETIRSIKEAEQQAEEILVKAQEQKEQILKDASLQAKQIHEELVEEAKRTAGGLDEKAREEAKNQEDKEAEKLKDVIEELKVSAREKKDAAVQLVLSELI